MLADDDLVGACVEVGFLLRQALAGELAAYGISPEQQEILTLVAAGHATARALSEASGRDKTTLSRVLARASRSGFLEQEPRKEDKRRKTLRLTERGVAVVEQTGRLLVESAPKLLAPLSPKDRRRLGKILKKLRASLAI